MLANNSTKRFGELQSRGEKIQALKNIDNRIREMRTKICHSTIDHLLATAWWALNLIEKKSSRIAESGFGYWGYEVQ